MANSNSINEHTNVEGVELFIIKTLLEGQEILIPDFGHLELKSLGERRTVLFKSIDSSDSFKRIVTATGEKEKEDIRALYTIISVPLKQGKIVNLPQVGVFRPNKRENGEIHVSFILSSYLRKLLNKESESVVEEVKEGAELKEEVVVIEEVKDVKEETGEVKEIITDSGATVKKEEAQKVEIKTDKPKYSPSYQRKKPEVGDTLVPQDDVPERSRTKGRMGSLLLIVVVFAVIVFVIIKMNNRKETDDKVEFSSPKELIDLPALAERHYGHPAFWIYIYEANSDKLNSPVNIPKHVSLVIPDLKTEFDVDVTDTMEIKRAIIRSDIVLKKRKIKN